MDGFVHNFELPVDATARDAVDGWVRLALQRQYGPVLAEALPPELAELVGPVPLSPGSVSPAPPPGRSRQG